MRTLPPASRAGLPRPLHPARAAAFGRPADPASWDYSPEWYGTAGGGYGRTDGTVIYAADSQHNGRVTVTAHPCSLPGREWRVLRFNDTRQSVAQVVRDDGDGWRADPRAAAFEYVKSIISLSLAVVEARAADTDSSTPVPPPSILCLGVGGGTVPLALAATGAGRVVGVDLDSAVLAAAPAMGLPAPLPPNMDLVCGDAVDYVNDYAGPAFDLCVIDCFDGQDRVPPALLQPPFLARLAAALHPRHGAAILNLHCGPSKPVWQTLAESFGGESAGPRFDTSPGSRGEAALAAASTLADAVVGPDRSAGLSAVVSARRQQNAVAVAARGAPSDAAALAAAATTAAGRAGFAFDAGDRACFGLHFL